MRCDFLPRAQARASGAPWEHENAPFVQNRVRRRDLRVIFGDGGTVRGFPRPGDAGLFQSGLRRARTDAARLLPSAHSGQLEADDGKFERTKYEKFLLENNQSAPLFELRLKGRELQKDLFTYINGGTKSPKFLIKNLFEEENRKLEIPKFENVSFSTFSYKLEGTSDPKKM